MRRSCGRQRYILNNKCEGVFEVPAIKIKHNMYHKLKKIKNNVLFKHILNRYYVANKKILQPQFDQKYKSIDPFAWQVWLLEIGVVCSPLLREFWWRVKIENWVRAG